MSVSLVLLPLAIALGVTVPGAAYSMLRKDTAGAPDSARETASAPIPTDFNDAKLLEKTLREHGLPVTVVSDRQLTCLLGDMQLHYCRDSENAPFTVRVTGIRDMEALHNELICFEKEYKQNVQSYTYDTLVANLEKSHMRIAEEAVLADNSILLTIEL